MIVIIDYGIGNLGSVVKAFKYLNIPVTLSADVDKIKNAAGVVLPGVGAFGEGMDNLRKNNLIGVIHDIIDRGVPFLGICLGLQLLFTSSEEAETEGLGLIKGNVKKFTVEKVGKIPHMGWNQVELNSDDPLFANFNKTRNFYFVHSYYVDPDEEQVILGKTQYGDQEFVSVIRKDNVWGFQCHPEKSSNVGLRVLKNYSRVVKKWK